MDENVWTLHWSCDLFWRESFSEQAQICLKSSDFTAVLTITLKTLYDNLSVIVLDHNSVVYWLQELELELWLSYYRA